MALHEDGDSMVYRIVLDLPKSQGQTSETPWQYAVVTHSHVQMEGDNYEFYYEVAEDDTWA